MKIETASKQDAPDLAYLINLAGEGMPEYMWSGMVEGSETPFDVGVRRAQREEGGFSYTKARVIREGQEVAGMIIDYALDEPYNLDDLEEYPEPVRPLVKLESLAPGSWYVNALATKANFRKRGIATTLLKDSEQKARGAGIHTLSIIVAGENTVAKDLYLHFGFQLVEALPVVPIPQMQHEGNWELLVKAL